MITTRQKVAVFLLLLAAGSAWLLHYLTTSGSQPDNLISYDPDYYMEYFSTTEMDADGLPKNRLHADYMAHYPDNDTTELTRPRLEVFQENKEPLTIIADKGWVTSNNEVLLLTGAVNIWQDDKDGIREMEIVTTDVKILPKQEYAETDKKATFINKETTITATGVRAYFREERLELLDNVHTKIMPDEKY